MRSTRLDHVGRLHHRYTPGSTDTGIEDWGNCTRCRLSATRKRVAILREGGEGSITLLFIGEAPGESEDATGYPFIGPSGLILNRIFKYVPHPFKYVITNTVGCRPVDLYMVDAANDREVDLSKFKYGDDYELQDWNREPTQAEIRACKDHIHQLVETRDPQGIVYLGNVAKSYDTPLPSLSLIHPAAILRLECKLLTVLKEARKLEKFIERFVK